ncbi:AAA family ATPase [Citricoccus nitrophenolicus]|uniref:AAA family ATPase n=1 Tax=Citricoccus nitrophenolicus TaxID=863575 RepID=UPI0039B484B0
MSSAPLDPWNDAGPAPSRPRPGTGSAGDEVHWSTRSDLRKDVHQAQDDPSTGFESVASRVQRDYARRPALNLWSRGWRALGGLWGHDRTGDRMLASAKVVQSPVTTGRRLAVVSLRGGAGKTTVSALMAASFATLRPEPVAALDLDPACGSLGLRLGNRPAPGAEETAAGLAAMQSTTFDSVASLMSLAANDLYYTGPRVTGRPLGEAATTTLLSGLSRYFPVTVIDCPTGLEHPDTAAVLTRAHAAVFVVPATAAGVDEAAGYLRHWQSDPFLGAIPVVAAVVGTAAGAVLDPLSQAAALTRIGVGAVAVRHDRHIGGGVGITLPLIRPENRLAAAELSAQALAAANAAGSQAPLAGGRHR